MRRSIPPGTTSATPSSSGEPSGFQSSSRRIRRDFRQPDGNTRAERAVRIAKHLLAHGIDTPEPLGLEVTPEESILVVRKLEGAVQIRAFFLRRDDPDREAPAVRATFEEVVTALGRLARHLHDAGVFFRDFTDGNILVTEGEAGPRLWLVDLDRARIRSGPLLTFNRLRDLARPGPESGGRPALPPSGLLRPRPGPASRPAGPRGAQAPDRRLGPPEEGPEALAALKGYPRVE